VGADLPFTNTPEQSVRLTVRYEWEDWYAHVRLNQKSRQLNRVDTDSSGDIYRVESLTIDLNVNYQVTTNLSIDLEINNLLSEPADEYYEGILSQRSSYLTHGWNAQLSFRWQM